MQFNPQVNTKIMARSKSDDYQAIKCEQPQVINYLSHLYGKNEDVECFLRRHFARKTIDGKTHLEVYQLIEEELGIPIP